MSRARRRITLQLIPLLDLLLIVLFAQFMQIQEVSKKQAVRTEEAEKAVATSAAQLAADRAELARLQGEIERERLSLSVSLKTALGDRDQVSKLAAEMLKLPEETIRKALNSKSEEEVNRLRKLLAGLPSPKAADVVHQLATLSELRRTCDVWQIHIDDSSVLRVSVPPTAATSFRAESPAEFDRRLFDWFKTLPPPKSVVIIQLTWGDATFGTKYAAKEGLVKCAERMRKERSGHSIFEYVVLGFRPTR
ncbi:MAG: hypothetical protein JWN70_5544 [Planctomycetaceae bacterium]|nr:hypothetical protein [Planctomycetaceae bacterium]